MDMPTVRTVEPAERSRAMSIQMLAFVADPCMRWLWPDPDDYLGHFPELLTGFGGRAFDHGMAEVTDDFRGGTMWLPPGVTPDEEALDALAADSVRASISPMLGRYFEQMAKTAPTVPHWHLTFIGVDPTRMGQGIGGALLGHALERIDVEGGTAYLESTNPRNITLYQRHGFEVVREIQVGDGPPLFPMLRPAR
jgi:ribosomal protein S18 acetylase RimI-like enzyme